LNPHAKIVEKGFGVDGSNILIALADFDSCCTTPDENTTPTMVLTSSSNGGLSWAPEDLHERCDSIDEINVSGSWAAVLCRDTTEPRQHRVMLRSTDSTWTKVLATSTTKDAVRRLTVLPDGKLFLVTGGTAATNAIWRRIDGKWTSRETSNIYNFNMLRNGSGTYITNEIKNGNDGKPFFDATIYKTDNFGETWNLFDERDARTAQYGGFIDFYDNNRALAFKDNIIKLTDDGGKTWVNVFPK